VAQPEEPREPGPGQGSPARRRIAWVLAAAAVLALAALDHAARPVAGRRPSAAGAAAWIWSADPPADASPRAFYLVQDFEVEEVPPAARLLVLGDEEYVVHLNGFRVGAGRYAPGASLDRYEAGPLLTAGANRLVAEVRSGRGVGGLLLRLDGGEEGPTLAATDGTWRVFRRGHPGLAGGWLPLAAGEPPRVWGAPPVGRWGRPRPGPVRPLFPPIDRPLVREEARPMDLPAGEKPPQQGGAAAEIRERARGDRVLFDFGRPVRGYLGLGFAAGAPQPAVFCVGLTPPARCGLGADGSVLAPPDARDWEDSAVRRLRYLEVVGLAAEVRAWLVPVPDASAGALAGPAASRRGVLGLEPPPRPTPVERDVARRLHAGAEREREP
jgi:hypothetical protein